jgi:hypothetical protein
MTRYVMRWSTRPGAIAVVQCVKRVAFLSQPGLEALGRCIGLRTLNLSFNKLLECPPSISRLPYMNSLSLAGTAVLGGGHEQDLCFGTIVSPNPCLPQGI